MFCCITSFNMAHWVPCLGVLMKPVSVHIGHKPGLLNTPCWKVSSLRCSQCNILNTYRRRMNLIVYPQVFLHASLKWSNVAVLSRSVSRIPDTAPSMRGLDVSVGKGWRPLVSETASGRFFCFCVHFEHTSKMD